MATFVAIPLIVMTHACVTQLTDKQDYRFFNYTPSAVINNALRNLFLAFLQQAILAIVPFGFLGIEILLGGYLVERERNEHFYF